MYLKFVDCHNCSAPLIMPTSADNCILVRMIKGLLVCPLKMAIQAYPKIYDQWIQEFWKTAKMSSNGKQIEAIVLSKHVIVNEEVVRVWLGITDESTYTSEPLPKEDLEACLEKMGYEGSFSPMSKPYLPPFWKYLAHIMFHCISPQKSGWDHMSQKMTSVMVSLITRRKFNFSNFIYQALVANVSATKHKFIMYPRFIQMILNGELPAMPKLGTNNFVVIQIKEDTFRQMKIYKGYQYLNKKNWEIFGLFDVDDVEGTNFEGADVCVVEANEDIDLNCTLKESLETVKEPSRKLPGVVIREPAASKRKSSVSQPSTDNASSVGPFKLANKGKEKINEVSHKKRARSPTSPKPKSPPVLKRTKPTSSKPQSPPAPKKTKPNTALEQTKTIQTTNKPPDSQTIATPIPPIPPLLTQTPPPPPQPTLPQSPPSTGSSDDFAKRLKYLEKQDKDKTNALRAALTLLRELKEHVGNQVSINDAHKASLSQIDTTVNEVREVALEARRDVIETSARNIILINGQTVTINEVREEVNAIDRRVDKVQGNITESSSQQRSLINDQANKIGELGQRLAVTNHTVEELERELSNVKVAHSVEIESLKQTYAEERDRHFQELKTLKDTSILERVRRSSLLDIIVDLKRSQAEKDKLYADQLASLQANYEKALETVKYLGNDSKDENDHDGDADNNNNNISVRDGAHTSGGNNTAKTYDDAGQNEGGNKEGNEGDGHDGELPNREGERPNGEGEAKDVETAISETDKEVTDPKVNKDVFEEDLVIEDLNENEEEKEDSVEIETEDGISTLKGKKYDIDKDGNDSATKSNPDKSTTDDSPSGPDLMDEFRDILLEVAPANDQTEFDAAYFDGLDRVQTCCNLTFEPESVKSFSYQVMYNDFIDKALMAEVKKEESEED